MEARLAPSGRRFLPELSTLAELAIAAAGVLRERLDSAIGRPDHVAALAAHVREADRLAAAVTNAAAHALVPPIDGDDATELALCLRDVVETTRRINRLADAMRPGLPDATVSQVADLLVQAVDSLEGAAATLTDRSRALDFASDVRRLAREGDRAYADALGGSLLTAATDPVAAVRQAEMNRLLCEALRACARAAAPVERIALKRF